MASLQSRLSSLITAIGADIKSLSKNRRQRPIWFTDLPNATSGGCAPFVSAAVAGGGWVQDNPTAGHPGVVKFTSFTTANSGFRLYADVQALLLSKGDIIEVGFQLITTSGTTVRAGFFDTATITAPTDGAYLEIAGTTASAKTANNNTATTAATTATVNTTAWYRARIEMVDTADVRITLFDDAGTVVLAEQSITTNLPTGAGRFTGGGIIATNSGTSTVDLIRVDYIEYQRAVGQELTR